METNLEKWGPRETKQKLGWFKTLKREFTTRIKKQALNHSHILTHTHTHKHTNVDLHKNTLTLVEVITSSKPHIGCNKNEENSHIYICTHTHTNTYSARLKNEYRKLQNVRQFHQFCLFFVYQNLENLLPKFYFSTKNETDKKRRKLPSLKKRNTKSELLRNT